MTEMRLNNCLLLHVHKDVTDAINLEDIAKEFVTHKVESVFARVKAYNLVQMFYFIVETMDLYYK